MRAWFKYVVGTARSAPIDATFAEHAAAMGGYDADDSYRSRSAFFARHVGTREAAYDAFLRKHLDRDMETLSVGSGRSAVELGLVEAGYRITCSDLAPLPCEAATRALFPGWRFFVHDILAAPAPASHDAVVSLSMIYLFDDVRLARFLAHARASLRPGGRLILDSAGSPDNLLSWVLHDVWLPCEAHARVLRARLRGRRAVVTRKRHGWRRTNGDIVGAARRAGFELLDTASAEPLVDFRRSVVLDRALARVAPLEPLLRRLGERIPYVRLFCFRRA